MDKSEARYYEFGPFRLDTSEGLLLRNGQEIPIQPKVFNTLRVLVQDAPHIFSIDELLNLAWTQATVERNSVEKSISALRKILGAESIETVPRRGYRFTVPVRVVSDFKHQPTIAEAVAPLEENTDLPHTEPEDLSVAPLERSTSLTPLSLMGTPPSTKNHSILQYFTLSRLSLGVILVASSILGVLVVPRLVRLNTGKKLEEPMRKPAVVAQPGSSIKVTDLGPSRLNKCPDPPPTVPTFNPFPLTFTSPAELCKDYPLLSMRLADGQYPSSEQELRLGLKAKSGGEIYNYVGEKRLSKDFEVVNRLIDIGNLKVDFENALFIRFRIKVVS